MKTKGKPGAGLIEDRRKPAPKQAYLAHFEKLILNPPWKPEDKRDPAAGTGVPKMRFPTAGYDATAARRKIGERYSKSLSGYHPPASRRSGV